MAEFKAYVLSLIIKLTYSPVNYQELFNLRHSLLRNAIERIFGILKKRFKIFKVQLEFPFSTQVKLVNALCCLHNIIRLIGGADIFNEEWELDEIDEDSISSTDNVSRRVVSTAQVTIAKLKRDEIAKKI